MGKGLAQTSAVLQPPSWGHLAGVSAQMQAALYSSDKCSAKAKKSNLRFTKAEKATLQLVSWETLASLRLFLDW